MHLLDLGKKVKESVTKAGLVGYQFNTIGVRSPQTNRQLTPATASQWAQAACATPSKAGT
jgi:dihydroxyacid dehydratase/phosphogluconate dehydratase